MGLFDILLKYPDQMFVRQGDHTPHPPPQKATTATTVLRTSKSLRTWTRTPESRTHQSLHAEPSQSNSKHQTGDSKWRVLTQQYTIFFFVKRDKINLVLILFLLEELLGFNTTLNFWTVSLIWEIVQTATDGTQNWLMSSILYWRRECTETLIKTEATICRSLLKLSGGSLDS